VGFGARAGHSTARGARHSLGEPNQRIGGPEPSSIVATARDLTTHPGGRACASAPQLIGWPGTDS
jgi:hypothetical protein